MSVSQVHVGGRCVDTQGNGGKGINWNSAHEVGELREQLTRTVTEAAEPRTAAA